jgi:hypothetical protein
MQLGQRINDPGEKARRSTFILHLPLFDENNMLEVFHPPSQRLREFMDTGFSGHKSRWSSLRFVNVKKFLDSSELWKWRQPKTQPWVDHDCLLTELTHVRLDQLLSRRSQHLCSR